MEIKSSDTKNDKHKITWEQYLYDVCALTIKVKQQSSIISVDRILALPRGGAILGTIFSHQLGLPVEFAMVPKFTGCTYLVVDDLIDTGKTLNDLHKICQEQADTKMVSAVVYTKRGCNLTDYNVDFFSRVVPKKWVEFPYESSVMGTQYMQAHIKKEVTEECQRKEGGISYGDIVG
jgi:hypoxanthine phosphoribosyltransferase